MAMKKLTYTGTNYDEVKRLCGDRILAPYFCMGFSMLSVDTGEGFVSVNEGDTIVLEDDSSLRIEKDDLRYFLYQERNPNIQKGTG